MPTANSLNSARAELWILGAGIILCLFLHLALLSGKPGLHYDEAWAMNYSWRIASEPGFWPWRAMSPYTFPVAHYWAAGWLKLLGPSLSVFRLSQVVLSLGAIFLLTYELLRMGFTRAASFFPLAAALIPALVLNHRFAIELNGVHPLLFAIMLTALLRKRPGTAAICWVVATMAHVLFYGVGLALIAACLWVRRKFSGREYRAVCVGAWVLAFFFLHVLLSIPEKGKAAGLLLSALVLPIFAFPGLRLPGWRPNWLLGLAMSVFCVNLFAFSDGMWTVAIFTGQGMPPIFLPEVLVFTILLGWLTVKGARKLPAFFFYWYLFALIVMGVMMLKPAPRYFELTLFGLSLFAAFGIAELSGKKLGFSLAFLAAHATAIYVAFFTFPVKERNLQLAFFKDSSRDFLSKQELARFLGGNGCRLGDIKSVDSRVREALVALARADWPVSGSHCRWSDLRISHGSGGDRAGDELVGDFVLEGKFNGP